MIGDVSRNKREKYSEIHITWWEEVVLPFNGSNNPYNRDFRWWLEDAISFNVGDDRIYIPIDSQGEDMKIIPKGFYFGWEKVVDIYHQNWAAQDFLIRGDYHSSATWESMAFIFGSEDNIHISQEEFTNAGGSITLEWDVEEYVYQIVIQPPSTAIGVNKSFSTTLEGSVPAIFIEHEGSMLQKRVSKFYTEFYGKVHNILELEYEYISSPDQLHRVAQKLLEKYSFGNTSFHLEYWEHDSMIIDNKSLVPQTVTIDSTGRRTTNDAFIYNRLDSLPEKPLSELGSTEHTLDDVQFYPLAFLS